MGGALSFQRGSRDKPLPLKPLSIGLTRSGILRVRIERMPIILDLFAIGIGHNTQRTRERGCASGRTGAREGQRWPDACTRTRAGSFRGCIARKVVQGHALSIGEDGFGLPIHRHRGSFQDGRCTALVLFCQRSAIYEASAYYYATITSVPLKIKMGVLAHILRTP